MQEYDRSWQHLADEQAPSFQIHIGEFQFWYPLQTSEYRRNGASKTCRDDTAQLASVRDTWINGGGVWSKNKELETLSESNNKYPFWARGGTVAR